MYTIKEVAKKMEVSEHTLRFWAKCGFFPFVERDKNNVRVFSESDLDWVKIVKCLRACGTDNKSIKKYLTLCLEGDSTLKERFDIIKETKKKALSKMEELKQQLEMLDYKEQFYMDLIKNNKKDIWNPISVSK